MGITIGRVSIAVWTAFLAATGLACDGSKAATDAGASTGGDASADVGSSNDAPGANLGDAGAEVPADGPVDIYIKLDFGIADRALRSGDVSTPALPSPRSCVEHTSLPACRTTKHDNAVRSIDFSPDGQFLVAGVSGIGATVWKVTATGLELEGRVFPQTTLETHMAFSPDGTLLAVGGGTLKLWDFANGTVVADLTGHPGAIFALGWSSDGKWLVSADSKMTMKVWDVANRVATKTLALEANAWSVAISPKDLATSLWTAVGLAVGGLVPFMDLRAADPGATAKLAMIGTKDRATYGLALSPNGLVLGVATNDRQVNLWDVANLPTVAKTPLFASDSLEAFEVAFSRDGQQVAAVFSSDDFGGAIRTKSLAGGIERGNADINWSPISVAFSPDGKAVAAGEFGCGLVIHCQ